MAVINDATQTGTLSATNLTSGQFGAGRQLHVCESRQRARMEVSCIARIASQTTACAAGGSGAMAMYVNGAWSCAGGGGGRQLHFSQQPDEHIRDGRFHAARFFGDERGGRVPAGQGSNGNNWRARLGRRDDGRGLWELHVARRRQSPWHFFSNSGAHIRRWLLSHVVRCR